jgi:hypothetical protein
MRTGLIWIFYFGLLWPIQGQSKADQRVLDAELRRFAQMIARDTQQLRAVLHPDLVYIHSNAMVENKSEHLNAISAGRVVYQEMKPEERFLQRYRKTALIHGTLHVKGIIKGSPFDVRLAYIAIYRKKKKYWQLLNWQSTRL